MEQEKRSIFGRLPKIRLVASLAFMALALAVVAGWAVMQNRRSGGGSTTPILIVDNGSDGRNQIDTPFLTTAVQDDHTLLRIGLSQGQAQPYLVTAMPVTAGQPLTAAEIEQILSRLSPLTGEGGDVTDFRLPDASLPPPRPGETILESFPPPPTAAERPLVPDGPLVVLRYTPEGEVPVAPFLSVTFNQPMVPLTTLENLTAADVPVTLTPAIPGVWKWLGTQTLTFEYSGREGDRFPMATEYVVEIPAGTQSATGGVLAESVTWRFHTPPVRVQNFYPQGNAQPLDPIFFISFDQAVDPTAVLAAIRLSAGSQTYPLQLATTAEIEANDWLKRLAENERLERRFAFRPQQTLPADTEFVVTIGPGAPSAEGPLLTTEAQSFNFRTYAPLRIEEHRCGWYDGECPPFTPFHIHFNNLIDADAYNEEMVRIEPALPGAVVNLNGNTLTIQGATQGRTTYRVIIDGSIQDEFGQTLGRSSTLTFRVGSAPHLLTGPDRPMITLDPARPALTLYSINYSRLNLRVYAVTPADWPAYQTYLREAYQNDPPSPPGRLVLERSLPVEAAADALTETAVDLNDVLNNGFGQFIVIVEPPATLLNRDRDRYNRVQTWVQVTQIGLDTFVDHSQMVVWATALADGAPLAGVTVRQEPGGAEQSTGPDGTARFDLSGSTNLLVAQQGSDTAILASSLYYWDETGWHRQSLTDELRWYVFDDRAMYRPGEEIHLKGWLRRVGAGPTGDVELVGAAVTAVNFQVMDAQGNQIHDGSATVNALGGFDLAFSLPENMNLGYAYLQFRATGPTSGLNGTSFGHNFQVQEFRRPEFEVTARNETTGPYFVGDQATVAVAAHYFAGGPLPNAEVTWQVTSTPGHYAPPNWPDFIFGSWTPWWFDFSYAHGGPIGPWPNNQTIETFIGATDATGQHYLQLDFEALDTPRPFSVQAGATVMDVNRQAWSAGTNLLVHPADLYVGLRSDRIFVPRGTPLEIEAIVTDLDGQAMAGHTIQIRAARLEWRFHRGMWQEEEADGQACSVVSATEPVSCVFTTAEGGSYQITATVRDSHGRQNQSQFTRWVSGGERPPARQVEQEAVSLIPNQETYQPGDVAEILVQAPFSPAEGLLIVSRSGILYSERFQMGDEGHTLRIPITAEHLPNLHVQVELVGAAPRTNDAGDPIPGAPPRPAYATGRLVLSVPPLSRALSVQATLQESELAPGQTTTLDVMVTDANGRAVDGAELAVVVVDEAVLALTQYQLSDPLTIFYQHRAALTDSFYGRAAIVLVNPESLAGQLDEAAQRVNVTRIVGEIAEMAMDDMAVMSTAPPPMAQMEGSMEESESGPEAAPIQIRRDFNPLATFAPAVSTNANGQAQVTVQLPDNLTRYRVMVVAVDGGRHFGTAEANLTARLPLMVRPSAPRFLNFGDHFELPVIIQNQTGEAMTVDVVMRVTNLELTGSAGLRVTVPAHDRVEVRFPATTTAAGTARFQVAAVAGPYADAAVGEWPVYTPATTEAFATYGVLDTGAVAQPVAVPTDVFAQFGGLEITTSSTAVQALTDAVLYLSTYPYAGSEQLASRILGIASLRDVLTAFAADGLPAPTELETAVQEDINRLQSLQNSDGGYPVWERWRESVPFYSVYAAHALHKAQSKGFVVAAESQQRSLAYLSNIENHYPTWYGQQTRYSLSAYALYVRHLLGDTDAAKARRLYSQAGLDNLSLEAVAWLWHVLSTDPSAAAEVEAIQRHLNNRVVETAGAANFFTSYGDDDYLMLHSNRRTDAIILDALITLQPQSDLIPKVVNGLMAHRVRGRWGNTQENTFVLLALDRYFQTFEAETPEFVARIWLGEAYAGDHAFSGRTTDRRQTDIPMDYLVNSAGPNTDLILSKEGPGRLYYRLGLRYAPVDLQLPPLDMGFVVQRTYEAVDDPGEVYQDDEGVWHIQAGARVRVRLTLVATNRRYHVALVDSLPAGLEIINPDLAVSESVPDDPNQSNGRSYWWWRSWYEHQNLRDERAEAFTTLLWEGAYTYSYVARATTPGNFVVPPARAEEMYSPEVFGRSGSDRVIVE